jgi:hypothetical protein
MNNHFLHLVIVWQTTEALVAGTRAKDLVEGVETTMVEIITEEPTKEEDMVRAVIIISNIGITTIIKEAVM